MGMAGGAFKGDMERAKLRMQAASIANSRRAQEAQERHQREVLAEQARQADMADARANRALDIQEGRGQVAPEPQERRSPYSVFSNADILAQARQAAADRRLATLSGQNSTLGQFQQVVDMEKRQQQAKREQGQSTMASLMKMAMANGGVAPMAALNLANRRFGFDGKTRAIGAAGFTQNGDWFVDFLQKDQNGQLSRQTSTMPYEQQGQVFYGQAGIFDNADRAAWRKGMLDRKYSTQEVNSMSGLNATMLEGLDEAGLQRLEQGFADPSSGSDWKRDLAYRKQVLMEAKFAQKLGQNSLDAAQKYALYHFNEFNQGRLSTQEDVDAGRATEVGRRIKPTPKEMFDSAVKFYNDNMVNSDPAVNPEGRDKTGVQPQPHGDGAPQPTDQPQPDGGQPQPTDQPQPQLQNGGEAAPEEPEEEPPTDPHGTTRGYGHVIEGDDDLVSVAIKYNVSPSELMDLNGIKNRDEIPDLPAGTRLILPDGAKGAKPLPSDSKESQQGELDFGEGGAPVGDGGETAPPPAPEGGEGGGGGEGGEGGGAPPPPPPQNGGEEEDESNGMAAGAKDWLSKWRPKNSSKRK